MSAAPLLERLHNVRKAGDGRWMARCPAHEDKRASLSVRELGDGRVLLHDFGGCETRTILAMLGLEMGSLFPERLADATSSRDRSHWHGQREALKVLRDEARIIVICADDITNGRPLDAHDATRAALAAGRIAEAVEALYG